MSKRSFALAPVALLALLTPQLSAWQHAAPTVPQPPAPSVSRSLDGSELASLRLAAGDAQRLALPQRLVRPAQVQVHLDGATHTLVLHSHSLRAPGFRLLVVDEDGHITEQAPPPVTTVRGEVLGLPNSVVAGRLEGGRLEASVRLATHDVAWMIQPLVDSSPVASSNSISSGSVDHAVYRASDVVNTGEVCGADDVASAISGFTNHGLPNTSAASATQICELALEADALFHSANGSSVSSTQSDMEAIINGCEAIYLADVGVTYTITSSTVHTGSDPYTTTDAGDLLVEFRGEWLSNHVGVVRDAAHLFTGRNLDGSTIGVAYVSVICSTFSGFGLSQSRFSNNLASRIALTAHELGHNWSAGHCNGDPDCAIMCPSLGGCTGIVTGFGSASMAAIENHKSGASCLTTAGPDGSGPTVSSVEPNFGPDSGSGAVVIQGVGFLDDPATVALFDGVAGEILSIDTNSVVVVPPPGLAGEQVDVLVSDANGTSTLVDGFSYEWTIDGGDSAVSSISSADDVDRAFFDAPGGAVLTVKLRRLGATGVDLVPGLSLAGPGDQSIAIDEDDPSDPVGHARLVELVLPTSGTYRLDLHGVDGATGSYRLTTKLKPVRKLKSTVAVGPSTPNPTLVFDAAAGTQLKNLVVKARPAKGAFKLIEGLPSALSPSVVSVVGPGGALNLTDLVTLSPHGNRVKLSGLLLPELGTYTVTLEGVEASVGFGKLSLKLNPPKHKSVKHVANPELE